MASVALADIIVPTNFSRYVQKQTEEKSKFVRSGILQRSPVLDGFLNSNGGNTLNRPSWKDLANDVELTASDASGVITGGSGITPKGLTTFNEIAVRLVRTQQWGARKLQDYISGDDAMAAIAGRVSDYEARRLQALVLAILTGLFLDNDAAPSGTEHVAGDLTFDASGVGFVEGVTNFIADNLFNAQQTMGDSQEDLKILCVHSAVYTRMKKNNLIDFKQDSVTGASLATFQGLDVIYDDGMPKSSQVYDSYLFAPGALEIGWGNVEKGTEIYWSPEAGNGIGEEILFRRWMQSVHPMGHAYVGAATGGGPANTVLDDAASWERRCPERKQVKLARLKTREA